MFKFLQKWALVLITKTVSLQIATSTFRYNSFDMYKYADFYCQQDVNILRRAFDKFASDFQKEFNINPFNYVSISALANEVFNQKVYYPSVNMCKVGGQVREFMSQAIHSGRCMCAYNKKWDIFVIMML